MKQSWKIRTAHFSEVSPKKRQLVWKRAILFGAHRTDMRWKGHCFHHRTPLRQPLSFRSIVLLEKKKKNTCELLTSIDSTSYFFLRFIQSPASPPPASCCPARTGMRGAALWGPGGGTSACLVRLCLLSEVFFSNSGVSQPCPADHTSVCALALAFLFGNALKFVRPLNSSTVPAHSSPHRCVCVCMCACVRMCFPCLLIMWSLCVCLLCWVVYV